VFIPQQFMDAQAAYSFVVSQASRINSVVYRTKYAPVRYRGLIPVNTEGPEFIKSVTYFSVDQAGAAQWMNAGADDVPHVELIRAKSEAQVQMAAIGYDYTLEELAQAQMLNLDLQPTKAQAARLASEQFIDRVAFLGDAQAGFKGIANLANVTSEDAAATGTGSSTEFADKTPGQILADVNALLTGQYDDSKGVEMADTLILPTAQHFLLGTMMINDYSQTTVLDWLKEHNIFTMETGQQLTIRGIRGLETAGDGGTARAIAYRNAEEVVRLHMPMPFRFFPVWQSGPFSYEVPGAMRLGGAECSLPGAMRYLDGI
jgi:hypothetical protein